MNFNVEELNNIISFLVDLRDTCRIQDYNKSLEAEMSRIKRKSPENIQRISFMNPYVVKTTKRSLDSRQLKKKKLILAPRRRRFKIRED